MDATTVGLLKKMGLSEKLALEFFIAFARFEYALIATKFGRQRKNGTAEADWDKFIKTLENLDEAEKTRLSDAGDLLLKSPPKKLMFTEKRPGFRPVVRAGQTNIKFVLEGVKRARNNLFHGGKYYTPAETPDRNKDVVMASLAVIHAILDSETPELQGVRQEYSN